MGQLTLPVVIGLLIVWNLVLNVLLLKSRGGQLKPVKSKEEQPAKKPNFMYGGGGVQR